MKKIYSIIIVTLLLVFLSGCGDSTTSKDKFNHLFDGMKTGARDLIYEYTDEDKEEANDLLETVLNIDPTETSLDEIIITFNVFYSEYIFIAEQQLVILVYSYIFPTNEEVLDEASVMANLQLSFSEAYTNFLLTILDSEYKDEFFVNFSVDDIAYLEYQRTYFDEAYYELQSQLVDIELDYTTLLNSEDTTTLDLEEKYVELVNVNNQIARKLDYDNYMDYAYDQYERSYEYSDLTNINNAVKNDLVPNLENMLNEILVDMQSMSYASQITFSLMFTGSYSSYETQLNGLATYMGGEYLERYNYLWNEGEYYFGNSKSNAGAFIASVSDKQVAYFGPGYDTLFTVTHEFGHYAAGMQDIEDGLRNQLDLAEFQAQANELMLASYMMQNNTSSVYDTIAKYKLFECSTNVLVSVIVNDFEYQIYTKDNLQASDISIIMDNVIDSYDSTLEDGSSTLEFMFGDNIDTIWTVTAAASPGYYISYGMSLIPSFEHFFVTQEDLSIAKTKYFAIMNAGSDIFETVDAIGYHDPLAVNTLSDLFKDINDFIIV